MPLAVCATPIGNLEDVTLRVLDELRQAEIVLCEDTRHTAGLLERHGIAAAGRLRSARVKPAGLSPMAGLGACSDCGFSLRLRLIGRS